MFFFSVASQKCLVRTEGASSYASGGIKSTGYKASLK
jgi:hypothetical protein